MEKICEMGRLSMLQMGNGHKMFWKPSRLSEVGDRSG